MIARETITWEERRDAREVRRIVFCVEQGVPRGIETDALDAVCTHFVVIDDNQDVIGAARAYSQGHHVYKVERVAILKEYRKRGLGRLLMAAIEVSARKDKFTKIALQAQIPAMPFYDALGYLPIGQPFQVEGVTHIRMEKVLE